MASSLPPPSLIPSSLPPSLPPLLQVIKLGSSNESTRAVATEGDEGDSATRALLADYSVTPGAQLATRTPRTPANQDYILQVRGQHCGVYVWGCIVNVVRTYVPLLYVRSSLLF